MFGVSLWEPIIAREVLLKAGQHEKTPARNPPFTCSHKNHPPGNNSDFDDAWIQIKTMIGIVVVTTIVVVRVLVSRTNEKLFAAFADKKTDTRRLLTGDASS